MKWEHVDLFRRQVLIRETLLKNGIDGPPKTGPSIREADLLPESFDALQSREKRSKLIGRHVFLQANQRPWKLCRLSIRFKHILKTAKLRQRSPGQLRHTFVTLALGLGENVSWVSKMLGHSNVSMTLAKYNRYAPNLTRQDGFAMTNGIMGSAENGNNLVTQPDNLLKLNGGKLS